MYWVENLIDDAVIYFGTSWIWEYSYSVENTKMFCGGTEVANLVVDNGDDKVDCIW